MQTFLNLVMDGTELGMMHINLKQVSELGGREGCVECLTAAMPDISDVWRADGENPSLGRLSSGCSAH